MRVVSIAPVAPSALLLAPAVAQTVTVAGELALSEVFAIAENSTVQVRLVNLDAYEAGAAAAPSCRSGRRRPSRSHSRSAWLPTACRPTAATSWRRGSIRGPRRRAAG